MIVDSGANASGAAHVFLRGNVTISPVDPKIFIGLITVGNTPSVSPVGNVTLSDPKTFIGSVSVGGIVDSKGFIGLVTIGGISQITLSDPKGFIGLVSIAQPISTTFSGNVTLDAGSKTGITGNVTLSDPKTFIGSVSVGGIVDSKGFIGLVTIGGGTAWADPKGYIGLVTITGALNQAAGNVTLDPGSFTGIKGLVTLADSKTFIGLVTVGGIGTVTLADPKGFIGLTTTVAADPKGWIGLVTVSSLVSSATIFAVVNTGAASDPKTFIGLVTVGGISTLTLADPKGFIGLTTAVNGQAWPDPKTYIGLVTVGGIGTVTLSDPKGFIGLVTTVPTFSSGYTSLATIISAVGVATIVIPPSGQKIFVKTLHVSSLGRGEIGFYRANIATATAAVIPFTSLSTTGGFIEFFGESGSQWGLADDGLTAVINGSTATVSIGLNVRFA